MREIRANILSPFPPTVIFREHKAVDSAQEPQLETYAFHLPGPERAWHPAAGLALGSKHHASFQIDGLLISMSQFLPHQLEFGEHIKILQKSSPFSIVIKCFVQTLAPVF